MQLPTTNIRWIPEQVIPFYQDYAECDAWYSGDPNRLATYYSGVLYPSSTIAGEFYSDIYEQSIAPRAKFWGKQVYEERRTTMHVPIAGDIARASSDLLFSEPPKFTVNNTVTQQRLTEIIENSDVQNKLLEAAETASALGGVFIKINWDSEFANYPIVSIAQPDSAIPVFQWGILTSVTFFKTVREEETKKETIVYRLLERHTKGQIEYGLYKGDYDYLGMRIGLKALPETANLQDVIETGVDDLLVRYVANMKPNRKHRGSPYGQSDYASLFGLMDALDETYSSWIRDIRLSKARIMVPESFLQKLPNGEFVFDIDREIFTPFEADPLSAQNVGIVSSQFDIRAEQYEKSCLELLQRIITGAGYSPQTFGLNIKGSIESGLALNIRERQSFITREKKSRYWKTALQDIMYMMLQIDNLYFGSRIIPEKPAIEFQDSIQSDLGQIATAVETLARAQSASIETRIRYIHPDWSNDQIIQETDKIKEEIGLTTVRQEGDING